MKKTLLVGLLIIMTLLCLSYLINDSGQSLKKNNSTNNIGNNKNINTNSIQLLNYEEYKNIRPNNIKNIEIVRLTVDGADSQIIKEKKDIIKIYNILNKKHIGEKSSIYTTDNTILYIFTLMNDTKVTIEIEADCIVIKDERYILE